MGSDDEGKTVRRRIRVVMVPGPESSVIEAVVVVPSAQVVAWEPRHGVRPALMFEECVKVTEALRQDPAWRDALARRGITDIDKVQIDPWPTGNFAIAIEENRRIARCLSYYRESPRDNGYGRPIEGLIASVDAGRGEVLEVVDHGPVPIPPERASYYPEDQPSLRTGLRPLDIVQPEGPSFVIDSNLIAWQRWSLRVSMDPFEGLVLHTVGYEDQGRRRRILQRASISEMVVPYGDPGPLHGWKNAFDAGEWGLGRMANSLKMGCDCLGEIAYLDAILATEQGEPYVIANAICIHEEDYGILWKHQDMHTGRTEVRRSRRLVVSSIATVGNYEYGFYWYFYLDGTIGFEVKLTGILSTQAVTVGQEQASASMVAPGLNAPVHQHLFCSRLDFSVDGPVNEIYEVSCQASPPGEANPWGNGFTARLVRLDSELQARRDVDPASARHWKIVNPRVTNRLGQAVAYKLVPGPIPVLLADPESSISRRAGFGRHNLWVTPYSRHEKRAAGDYPNQHPGGEGVAQWTDADRSLLDTEIVVWHTFGASHVPRPEDWPVMPVEYCGFQLVPAGFFDANPALDLPPSATCH